MMSRIRSMATASGGTDAPRGSKPQPRGEKLAMWSAKGISTVGTVNITTLFAPAKLRCTIEEINRYRWDVLGIAETHWVGEGEMISEGVKILYSGRTDNIHREGVAILLGKRAQRAYIEHNAVNSRIISVTLRGQHKNCKIIQVYAPDSSHEDEEVENFYAQLEEELERTRSGDIVMVIGDFNSKIGNDNRGYEDVMGKFGLGERNERGERMLEFCQDKQLCITNTYFYHRQQHRYTWTHPDGLHKNCIDYILINKRWKTSVMGTRVMRGADFGTSHELLLSNIRIRFRTENGGQQRLVRYDLDKLKREDIRTTFQARIGGRFEPLIGYDGETEEKWCIGRDAIREEAENILGRRRTAKQQWVTEEVLDACDERREAKKAKNINATNENKERYRRKSRIVEDKCKRAKIKWIEDQCKIGEECFRNGRSKELFATVERLTRGWKNNTSVVRDIDGNKIGAPDKVKGIWKSHYEEQLKGSEKRVTIEEYPELRREPWNRQETPDIIIEEVRKAIRTLANGKAPGIDGIPKELLAAGGERVERWLQDICKDLIEGQEAPNDWTGGIIIPMHKKGDTTLCKNYRPISLMPHAYKVLAKIIQNRIMRQEEEIIDEGQAGFRMGRGTIDHVFTFAQIIEKFWEKEKDIYCAFIDFRQAFDSIWREGMIEVLKQWGLEQKILETIRRLYENTSAQVRKGNLLTEEFKTSGGVIQGCPLSPHLFNLYLEWVIRLALEDYEGGIEIGGVKISNMRYADDIVLVAETREELQRMVELVEEQCSRYELVINRDKTKCMKIGREREALNIQLAGGEVEQVNEFKYLGVYFTEDGKMERTVQDRISMGQKAFGRLGRVWKDRNISRKLKIRLLRAIVIPTVLYGAECWVLKKREEKKLAAFEMKCLRRICGVRWEDRITNERVREMAGVEDTILIRVEDIQRRWFGHVQRMDLNRWPKKVLNGQVAGNRPRGRPRDSWLKKFKKLNDGKAIQQLAHMAQDRNIWKEWRHRMQDPTRRIPDGI